MGLPSRLLAAGGAFATVFEHEGHAQYDVYVGAKTEQAVGFLAQRADFWEDATFYPLSALDRLPPLVVHAHDEENALGPLVVQAQGRHRPSANDLASPESVRAAIERLRAQPIDRGKDALGKLTRRLRAPFGQVADRRFELVRRLRRPNDLQGWKRLRTRLRTCS